MNKDYINIQQVTRLKLRDAEMWDYKLITISTRRFNWNKFRFEQTEEKYWCEETDVFPTMFADNGGLPEICNNRKSFRGVSADGEERLFTKPRVVIYTSNDCFVKYFDTFDEAESYVDYLLTKNSDLILITD